MKDEMMKNMKIELVSTKKELSRIPFRDYVVANFRIPFRVNGKDVLVSFSKTKREMISQATQAIVQHAGNVEYSYYYEGNSYSSNNNYRPNKINFDKWIPLYVEILENAFAKEVKQRERRWKKSNLHDLKKWIEHQPNSGNFGFNFSSDFNRYRCPHPDRASLGCIVKYVDKEIGLDKRYDFEVVGKKYRMGLQESYRGYRRRRRYRSEGFQGMHTLENLKVWLINDIEKVVKNFKEEKNRKDVENNILEYLKKNFVGCVVKRDYGTKWSVHYPKHGEQTVILSLELIMDQYQFIDQYEPLKIASATCVIDDAGLPLSKAKAMAETALALFSPNPRFTKSNLRRVEISDGRIAKFEGMDFNEGG